MSERAPGFEDYIPSRLEWLALLINSHISFVDASFEAENNISRAYFFQRMMGEHFYYSLDILKT